MYLIFDVQRRSAIDNDLQDYADFLISGIVGNESEDLSQLYDQIIQRMAKPSSNPRVHKFILASNDSVMFEANALANLDSLIDLLFTNKDFTKVQEFYTFTFSETEYRLLSKPIKTPSRRDYQIIVITSLDQLYESLGQLRLSMFVLIPISLLAAGWIGLIIARKALKPVSVITDTAAAISSESLEQRVPIGRTQDELSRLAQTFNDMIARLDDTFRSQKRFIADVSHDVRTPITVVQLELELMLSSPSLPESQRHPLERCLKEVQRISHLADNLLILARADSRQLRLDHNKFRFDELIMECLISLNNLAQTKSLSFKLDVHDPVEIEADESLLRRAAFNILDNAIKYSHDHQTIDIIIEKTNLTALLTVRNYGSYISEDILPLVFNRFQRGDSSRSTQGFGLGLSIVKAIVKAHDGDVSIASSKAEGTTVNLLIPIK